MNFLKVFHHHKNLNVRIAYLRFISFPKLSKLQVRKTPYELCSLSDILGKRSAKELGNTPMDATTVCKSAYVSNNGTEVVGTLENGNCRFDLKVSHRV